MKISEEAKNGATIIQNIGCKNYDSVSEELQCRIDNSTVEKDKEIQELKAKYAKLVQIVKEFDDGLADYGKNPH